jgi:hypothetical protein
MGLSSIRRDGADMSRNGAAPEDEEKTDRAWLLGRLLLNAIRDAVEEAVEAELRRRDEIKNERGEKQ